ncbi:thermolysin [Streptomyces laurentii]|uniref:Thermolysin n=1 Tax=Streptomyces laurentii TaxID=39478 RepID=A0A160PA37_STRLU|nr:thermolysin [Streptomyces laurentii]
MKLSPSSGAVTVGGSVTSTLNTTLAKGTAQDIALTASGLPNGARATFSPASVTAGDSSAMTITTSPTTPNGTYAVRVTGTSPAISHTVTFTLTVSGGPCPDGQKLVNPGFEAGSTGWTATSGVIGQSTTQPPRSGTWNAHLDGYGKEHTDSLTQGVSLPQGCNSYTLDYWLRIDTAESSVNAWDTLKVQVLNSDGSRVLDTLKTYSNVNAASGYFQRTLDLAPYAGQDIVIRFLGTEDFALKTSFALDDITVNVS